MPMTPPSDILVQPLVLEALEEDLGLNGDITSAALVGADQQAKAVIVAREAGRIAGLSCASLVFAILDAGVRFTTHVQDGKDVKAGEVIATIVGPARTILAGERVALNFLGHLSGVATATRTMAEKLEGTKARLCCTRKTLPGLRSVQKYAVRVGGGTNHRFGLGDAMLIKDNHIHAAGSIGCALERARKRTGHMVKIEVEIDTLEQLEEALTFKPDAVLLDNMKLETLRTAVAMVDGRAITEASGGVTLDTIAAIAQTGVDVISTSAITMSVHALDLGLDFVDM